MKKRWVLFAAGAAVAAVGGLVAVTTQRAGTGIQPVFVTQAEAHTALPQCVTPNPRQLWGFKDPGGTVRADTVKRTIFVDLGYGPNPAFKKVRVVTVERGVQEQYWPARALKPTSAAQDLGGAYMVSFSSFDSATYVAGDFEGLGCDPGIRFQS